MKKKWSLVKGLLLLTACAGFLSETKVLEAKAAEVSLERGEEVFYDGYSTFYYYIDGKLGYCLEPEKSSPHDGQFTAEQLSQNTLLSKALYYMYGGPGYEKYMKSRVAEEYREAPMAYCLGHCVLSYVYDGCSGESDAFRGLKETMQNQVRFCVDEIQKLPDIPSPEIAFSKEKADAYFSPEERVQRTEEIQCLGDVENYVELSLPEGVTLVNLTKQTKTAGTVKVYGQDTFYLCADVADCNGAVWESGRIYGVNCQSWRSLVVSTGSDGQHLGTGTLITAEVSPVSLEVTWIPVPQLSVEKRADKTDKTFKVGDVITYSIDVTQQMEKAVAKNVVITDTILTEGVKLQKNSIVLLDKDQSIVSDAVISVKGNSYTIHAGEFLQGIETGEKYTIEYQVAITDASVIGKEIENEVVVRADNAEEEKDRETVKVEEPEEPEEPEKDQEEVSKKPEPPKQETSIAAPVEPVKTADEQNVGILALFLLLSCAGILGCGRMTHKIK